MTSQPAMASGRRRVRGNFAAMLKKLPESVADEFRDQLDKTGRMLLGRAMMRAPAATGKLRGGLSYKVLAKSLKLKVGLVGKPINRKLYYGRFVEFGRKAKTMIVTRRGTLQRAREAGLKVRANAYKRAALKAGITGAYRLRVRAMAPRHFVYSTPREQIYRPYQKLWGRALHRAAAGVSND